MDHILNTQLYNLSDIIDGDTEFIPLLSPEDEERMNAEDVPEVLPVLPLRNTVLFPGVVIPITVGREKSIKLIKDYYKNDRIIGVVSQKDVDVEDPDAKDISNIGTVAHIIKMLQMPDGNTTVIIQGKKRFEILNLIQTDPYFKAQVIPYESSEISKNDKEFNALISSLKDLALQIITLTPHIPAEAKFAINNIESSGFLVNFVSSNLNIDVKEKQKLLNALTINSRHVLLNFLN